jgi:hypothetical protein
MGIVERRTGLVAHLAAIPSPTAKPAQGIRSVSKAEISPAVALAPATASIAAALVAATASIAAAVPAIAGVV